MLSNVQGVSPDVSRVVLSLFRAPFRKRSRPTALVVICRPREPALEVSRPARHERTEGSAGRPARSGHESRPVHPERVSVFSSDGIAHRQVSRRSCLALFFQSPSALRERENSVSALRDFRRLLRFGAYKQIRSAVKGDAGQQSSLTRLAAHGRGSVGVVGVADQGRSAPRGRRWQEPGLLEDRAA